PAAVRDVPHGLERVVVVRRKAPLGQGSSDAFGLDGTELIRLEDRADRSLGGDGMLLDELPVAGNQAAEVLRPGTIQGALQDRVADLPRAQLLRVRREP